MASATMTAWDKALKQYYKPGEVAKVVYDSHPFLELVPKDTGFKGKNAPIPIYYTRPQGRSATFSTAQSNSTASKVGEFLLTRKTNYGVAQVSGEAAAASQGDRYSFLDAMTTEIDGVLRSVGDSISTSLFRDGSGAIGQVNNSSFGVTTLDLVTDNDVLNFEVGQVLAVAGTKTGSSVRSGTLTVSAVNRTATTMQVTMSGNLSAGISAIAQNDYVYVSGDYDGMITGLEGWIPATAPTSGDSFFGEDRSDDPTRLKTQGHYPAMGIANNVNCRETQTGQSAAKLEREGSTTIPKGSSSKWSEAHCIPLGW